MKDKMSEKSKKRQVKSNTTDGEKLEWGKKLQKKNKMETTNPNVHTLY